MKRLELSLLLAFIFCIAVSFISFENECNEIRGSVLRMHILANSDSEHDQQLKLLVRDRIIEQSENIFKSCNSYDEALTATHDNLVLFEQAAYDVLRENGCFYDVSAQLGHSYFPTRVYDNITLPAGVYEAVQIKIGSAQGRNWWCVMFPSICLPDSTDSEQLCDVLSDGQISIITNDGYELKFRCVEIYEQFMEKLREESRIAFDENESEVV